MKTNVEFARRPLIASEMRKPSDPQTPRRQSQRNRHSHFRAANELGLRTVAIYSQEDRLSLHRLG